MPSKKWLVLAVVGLVIVIVASALRPDSKWDGVDVAVVGKYATELGHQPWTPFINVQGDLQLFVFTVAGLVGGLLIGYHWRDLFGSETGSASGGGGAKEGESDVPGV
ncbi:MAG: hypothetical protein Q7R39_14330 [Dehalococcoidia bacterium]|nr:hypothetical protein [Dehalococcoidia bacterium]